MSIPIMQNNSYYEAVQQKNQAVDGKAVLEAQMSKNKTRTMFSDNIPSQADSALKGLSGDINQFVKLFLLQLKNQDPLDPMKASEISQQMAALTGVEQSVYTNKNLEKLIALNQGSLFKYSSDLIGKKVSYDPGFVKTDKTNIGGDFAYQLNPRQDQEQIGKVSVRLVDALGRIVHSQEINDAKPGYNVFKWNGEDDKKRQAPPGVYNIQVRAKDTKGDDIEVSHSNVIGEVTSSTIRGGKVFVTVNGKEIDVNNIVEFLEKENGKNEVVILPPQKE